MKIYCENVFAVYFSEIMDAETAERTYASLLHRLTLEQAKAGLANANVQIAAHHGQRSWVECWRESASLWRELIRELEDLGE